MVIAGLLVLPVSNFSFVFIPDILPSTICPFKTRPSTTCPFTTCPSMACPFKTVPSRPAIGENPYDLLFFSSIFFQVLFTFVVSKNINSFGKSPSYQVLWLL
jgi:hypothetical protein